MRHHSRRFAPHQGSSSKVSSRGATAVFAVALLGVAAWVMSSSSGAGHGIFEGSIGQSNGRFASQSQLHAGGGDGGLQEYDPRCDEVPRHMCEALNREPCSASTLLNTCGKCISEEYAVIGAGMNSPCVPKSKLKSDDEQQGDCSAGASSKKVLVDQISSASVSPTYTKLVDAFFDGKNPWEGYASDMAADHSYPHTSVVQQFLAKLFTVAQPELVVEYGSFKGGSAIIMASVLKELGMEKRASILCVDPWSGDVNMWTNAHGWRSFLMLEHGMPSVAEQFRVNIVDKGHQDVILPLQATSLVGIVSLWRLHNDKKMIPLPSVVFLDSAHEKDETFLEVTRVMRSLPPGGFMFGDDWGWYGVHHDVQRYVASEEGARFVNKSVPEEFFADWDGNEDRAKHAEDGIWLFDNKKWLLHKRMDQEAS